MCKGGHPASSRCACTSEYEFAYVKVAGCSVRMLMQVTFLYTLTDGAFPKSYGINVARLAGLPDGVVKRASSFATQLEEQHESRMLSMPLQPSEMQRLQSIRQGMTKDCISPDMRL